MKYTVHLFREMRISFAGIEADTLEAAAAFARDKPTSDADDVEDCEGDTISALVDVEGDTDYEQSRVIDFEPERQRKAASRLLAALKAILPYAENEARSLDELKDGPEAEEEADKAWKAVMEAYAVISDLGEGA